MYRIKLEKIVDEIDEWTNYNTWVHWKTEVDAIRTCINRIINDFEAENIDWKKLKLIKTSDMNF